MSKIITINNISPKNEGSQIEYTINFNGTSHNVIGDFVATKEEMDNAFKNVSGNDIFNGVKKLVLTRLENEAHNTLANFN